LAGKRIMIVDDDKDLLGELQETLSIKGYYTLAINDSTSAVDAAFSSKPDVILLDMKMDGMSGFQVAQSLRRLPSTSLIPIIAMTGVCTRENHLSAMELWGMDVCIEKPFNPHDLILSIQRVLRAGCAGGTGYKGITAIGNDAESSGHDARIHFIGSNSRSSESVKERFYPRISVLLLNSSDAELHHLKSKIEADKHIEIIGMARNTHEARGMIKTLAPDIVIMDLIDPQSGGMRFLKGLVRFFPRPVLVVSSLSKVPYDIMLSAIKTGVTEIIDKDTLEFSSDTGSYQGPLLSERIRALAARFSCQDSGKNPYRYTC